MSSSKEDEEFEVPKLRTVNKPKNLKKRKRGDEDEDDNAGDTKRPAEDLNAEESEYVSALTHSIPIEGRKGRFLFCLQGKRISCSYFASREVLPSFFR